MLKTFSITNIGKKRKVNQDYVYSSENPVGALDNLFLVADGMGGHKAGDYASRVTVETMVTRIAEASDKEPVLIFEEAIEAANTIVRVQAAIAPELEGMGTTVVAATVKDEVLYVANVGDSRLYVVNEAGIHQITRDHSWVEEMVMRGSMDREEARLHPDKNIITRAVGAESTIEADFFKVQLCEGDRILMCTDGLTNMLEDEEIRMILGGARDTVEQAEELVNAANEKGGRDNISVILIEPVY